MAQGAKGAPSGSGVRYEITGSEEALKRLDDVLNRVDNKKGLFDQVGASLVGSTQHRFDIGIGPDGVPWKPSFRARTKGGKTLQDTGRLVNSMTHNATDEMVEIGTNVIYAAIHQLGGLIQAKGGKDSFLKFKLADGSFRMVKSVNIPARPFLGLDEEDNAEIIEIADEYLLAALGPGPAGSPIGTAGGANVQ